jgi:hypothetical protein
LVTEGANGGFTMDDATRDAQLWYTTDGSAPTNGSPSRLYVSGARLSILNGTNDILFKVRAFKPGMSAPGTNGYFVSIDKGVGNYGDHTDRVLTDAGQIALIAEFHVMTIRLMDSAGTASGRALQVPSSW